MSTRPRRSGLALENLPQVVVLLLASASAGAAITPTLDLSRPPDTSAAVAEALASKPDAERTPAERSAANGYTALIAGDLARAESSFDQSLEADPKLTVALLGLADVRLRQKRPAEAETLLKKALALEPRNWALHAALGRYYYMQGDTAKAKTAYDAAIRLDPKAVLPHVDLGGLYATAERNPRAAAEEYRKALSIRPDYAPARLGLGLALLAAGDSAAALAELQRAAADSPNDPTAPQVIGRVQASQKHYDEAAKALTEALRRKPDFLPALADRADVYAAAGEDRKAAADYEQLAKLRPEDAVTRVKLGMLQQRMGETAKAEASYRAALKLNPDVAPAANNLAMIELRQGGDLDEALALARKATALAPQVPQFHDTLGQVLRAKGDRAGDRGDREGDHAQPAAG